MGGEENTAVGYEALKNNAGTSINAGSSNTAIGHYAMTENITGNLNTASGVYSLRENTTGKENTAAGFASLYANTTGIGNTGFGRTALGANTTGNYNTAIGFLANVGGTDFTNATAIGYRAYVTSSNSVQIGNGDITAVRFGNTSTSRLYAHSLVTPSDKRFKYNIQNNVPGLDFIRELQPVTYYFDSEKLDEYTKTGMINNSNIRPVSYKGQDALHTGFLAQDVERLAKKLGYSFDGVHAPDGDKDHYSLSYSKFIMPMVKAIQEQQEMIEKQNTMTHLQQKTIEKLQETIEKLEQKLEVLSNQ
ncbi:MAG: tail fiber domain-containing protein [Ginsengibacter sp.]